MRRRIWILTVAALLVISLFVGSAWAATVIDDMGRVVRVVKTPQRIVSTAPSITEILFAIGAGDRVVGRTDFCNYPPEVKKIPSIGGFSTPSWERIYALHPDLVIVTPSFPKELFDRISSAFTTMVLNPHTLVDIANDIRKVGVIVGKTHQAEAVAFKVEGIERAVRAFAPGTDKKVLFVLWYNPIMSVNKSTFIGQMLEDLKVRNITADLPSPWPMLNPEFVVSNDPDIIFMPQNSMGYVAKSVLSEYPWTELKATKDGRVFFVNDDWVFRPGPRIVYGLLQMAHYIYPSVFDGRVVTLSIPKTSYAIASYKSEVPNDSGRIAIYLDPKEWRTYISADAVERVFGYQVSGDRVVLPSGKSCTVHKDDTGVYLRLRDIINCAGMKVKWNGDYKEVYLILK